MKVIFMQKVVVVSGWKFARAVSVGVILSITHNGMLYGMFGLSQPVDRHQFFGQIGYTTCCAYVPY